MSKSKKEKLNLDYIHYLICSEINAKFRCLCSKGDYCETVKNIAKLLIDELLGGDQ